MKWKPIDTWSEAAGRSLENFIVFDGNRVFAAWNDHHGKWRDEKDGQVYPTHWMKFPDPPIALLGTARSNP